MTSRSRPAYRLGTWPRPPAPVAGTAGSDGDSGKLPGQLATLAAGLVGIAAEMMVLVIAIAVLFLVS